MPALRGVGGSLVYLIADDATESLWAREFAPVASEGDLPDSPAVRRFDHLASVVHHDEFLSWQLYWRALFGLEALTEQDVIDPSGLVHSQALQSADGAFRVTINASDARETLSSRFLARGWRAAISMSPWPATIWLPAARAARARGQAARYPGQLL
jgi:4-hydroxyphenylpyruvate dioxygenase